MFFLKALCCGYSFELHPQVDAIQMGTHNICLYKEVDKKYTGCNLKTTELLACGLIGVCAVIRSNTWKVMTDFDMLHTVSNICTNIPNFVSIAHTIQEMCIGKVLFFFFLYHHKNGLYNFKPIKSHFYIVKLGFSGVYIIFLILLKNIDCGYSFELPQ